MTEPAGTGISLMELLAQAGRGDPGALGRLLDLHRGYLRAIAQRELGGGLGARLDPSDLVQQTCLSALRNFPRFQGREVGEFVGWLRRIHERNVRDSVRQHALAARRAAGREQSIPSGGEPELPGGAASSPSARAMANEDAVRLTLAMEHLPDDQREAIRLRHLEGLSLAEIAGQLGRSEAAVAGLLKRGLQALRSKLKTQERGEP